MVGRQIKLIRRQTIDRWDTGLNGDDQRSWGDPRDQKDHPMRHGRINTTHKRCTC